MSCEPFNWKYPYFLGDNRLWVEKFDALSMSLAPNGSILTNFEVFKQEYNTSGYNNIIMLPFHIYLWPFLAWYLFCLNSCILCSIIFISGVAHDVSTPVDTNVTVE